MHQFLLDKQAMIPIMCAMIHNFIRMDPGSVARDHVTGATNDNGVSSDDDAYVSDGVHVVESSSHPNIQHDRDMDQYQDYVANCIQSGESID